MLAQAHRAKTQARRSASNEQKKLQFAQKCFDTWRLRSSVLNFENDLLTLLFHSLKTFSMATFIVYLKYINKELTVVF